MNSPEMEQLDICNICESKEFETIDKLRNFCKCKTCGYIFDNPRPTQLEIGNFYSQPTQYDGWLSHEKERNRLWKRRIKKLGTLGREGSLLDIGTGIGQFLNLVRQNHPHVVGTEVSKSAIKIAKEKYNLDIIAGDAIGAAIPTEINFSIITMFHVLEHVPNPKQIIEKCHTLLSQKGILIVAVPNDVKSLRLNCLAMIKRVFGNLGVKTFKDAGKFGFSRITLDDTMGEIHLSHFTPEVLQKCLENAGFVVIENSLDPYYVASGLKGILHKLHFLSMSLVKLLLNKNYYETIWITARKI